MSGYTMTQGELYYALPVAVTKNTYTTQACISALSGTSVPRCVIPALYFSQVGKCVRFKAAGSVGSAAGTATFIYAAGLDVTAATIGGSGGATLFTTGTITPATGTSPWDMDGDITCTAVGSGTANPATTLQFNGSVRVGTATANAFSTSTNLVLVRNTLTGVNNEVNLYLELFGTWSASSASNTTTLEQFKVYGEN